MTTEVVPSIGERIHIAVTHQRCPRRRLLEYGLGIEPVYLDLTSTTRRAIARGIRTILTGHDTQDVIRIILSDFAEEYATRGIDPAEGDPFTVYTEQAALIEAVLKGYDRHVVEAMRLQFAYIGDMLRERETGKMLSHVVRVVPDADRQTIARDLHSLYTVARAAYDAREWGEDYDGLWMQYVVVGDRRAVAGESARTQRSPFITGYRQQVGGRMSPTRNRRDPRTGRTARLGNDYKLFRVWETRSPVALDDWIIMLGGWGTFHDLFIPARVNPPEPRDAAEVIGDVEFINKNPSSLNLRFFPMYRHSCDLPHICPYQQMECCYGDIPVSDPTRGGVYRLKEDTHGNN